MTPDDLHTTAKFRWSRSPVNKSQEISRHQSQQRSAALLSPYLDSFGIPYADDSPNVDHGDPHSTSIAQARRSTLAVTMDSPDHPHMSNSARRLSAQIRTAHMASLRRQSRRLLRSSDGRLVGSGHSIGGSRLTLSTALIAAGYGGSVERVRKPSKVEPTHFLWNSAIRRDQRKQVFQVVDVVAAADVTSDATAGDAAAAAASIHSDEASGTYIWMSHTLYYFQPTIIIESGNNIMSK